VLSIPFGDPLVLRKLLFVAFFVIACLVFGFFLFFCCAKANVTVTDFILFMKFQ
jgi:hypothetical protein